MTQDHSGEYLRNAVMTASPEQLHLMLYDGAIRFCRQAKEALSRKDLETSCEKLLRAQRIVVELQNGLKPEVDAALCDNMARLYSFVYKCLVDANLNRDAEAVDAALRVLEHQRETWQLLMEKLRTESPECNSGLGEATSEVGEGLSVSG